MAAVDIGTNSTRLLIADQDGNALLRRTVVTGLGRRVAETGRLHAEGRAVTLETLERYRELIGDHDVTIARAVATAVGRNASDVGAFLDDAADALGVRPEVITGEEEAALSFAGAVSDLGPGDWTVVDIGGGSTEIVTKAGGHSYEIGSVKLTDRHLVARPVELERLEAARLTVRNHLGSRQTDRSEIVGVAGTWTSLAGLSLGRYDPDEVHHYRLTRQDVTRWIDRLSQLSVEETAALPGFDPARAPVILGGTIVAEQVMIGLGAEACLVSERDLLDGIVIGLRR